MRKPIVAIFSQTLVRGFCTTACTDETPWLATWRGSCATTPSQALVPC